MRSPSSPLVDVIARPSFFETVPERNPRTEWGCQPVAFISSFEVAPPGRFNRSRTLAALLPSRALLAFFALLGACLAGMAFFPDFPFFGATFAPFFANAGPFAGLLGSNAGFGCFDLLSVRDHVFSFGDDYCTVMT